jgi:hypothetical protein
MNELNHSPSHRAALGSERRGSGRIVDYSKVTQADLAFSRYAEDFYKVRTT